MAQVPRSVEEAAELAEKLHAQMFNQSSEEDTTEIIDPDEDSQDDVVEDEDEDTDEDDFDGDDGESDTSDEDDLEELRKFKKRYQSLQGKYNAEVPRMAETIRELKTSITQLAAQQVAQQQANQKPAEQEVDPLAKFQEEYGEDFVSDLRKLIDLEVANRVAPIQQATQSVEETQIKTAQENFKTYLDSKVDKGNWRELWEGKDQKFIEFLQKPDPSGLYTYGELVQLYNDNWEADKLATIFNNYFEASTTNKQQKRNTPNPQQDALIAPNRQNSQPTPKLEQGKIWTQQDIADFERLDRQGKFTADESKAMWDDLLNAMATNRIR